MEHFVKPMFIGRTSHVPFLMILLGVLGGLETFGLIGLFIGPIILSVFLEVWRHMLPPQSLAR
jgi:predicted PurR-regulated permease PerM